MIKFEKIKPGMELYDVKRATGFNAWREKYDWWTVRVIEVDTTHRRALVSWNGNPVRWMSEHNVTRYRAQLPKSER